MTALASLLAAPVAESSFDCGTALSPCRVELDNSGRAWFETPEKLTEDALGDGTPKNAVGQVYERAGNTTTLVSKGADGTPFPFDPRYRISAMLNGVSPDGERVYISAAAALTPDDTDPVGDNSLDGYELADGQFRLLTTGPLDQPSTAPFANNGNSILWASDDGRHVLFLTSSRMTEDDWDSFSDIYERADGRTRLVSTGPDETLPTLEFPTPFVPEFRFLGASPDGATAYFSTFAHITPDEPGKSPSEGRLLTSDIFAWQDGTTRRITRTISPETVPGTPWEAFEPYSFAGAAEGSVYFAANSGQVPEDTDLNRDVYRARPDGSLERVISSPPPGAGAGPGFLAVESVSRDGSRLFLRSSLQLVPEDRDPESDIYMWSAGTYHLVSPKGELRGALEEELHLCSISGDGRRAYFQTWASLSSADTDDEPDVYEWSEGTIRLVSPASDGRQTASFCSGISPNGRFVAFSTWEELLPGDNDLKQDVYVIDMGPGAASSSSATASRKRPAKNRRGKRRLRLITAESIPPKMGIAAKGAFGDDGAHLKLRCPKSERSGPCHGRVVLLAGKDKKVLARGKFRIAPKRSARVELKNVALPSRRGSLTVLARARGADLLGNKATVERRVDLGRTPQRHR